MRKFYLLLLFLPFLLPVSSMAQNQIPDTVYVFRFVSHKDMFYVPWKDNETQLDHLLVVVETHKATILSGEVPLLIDGYCASEPTSVENLKLARVSSNRVKSELILEKGLNESCFITHNHTAPYGDLRHVVIVRLRFPQEEVEEKPIVGEKETFIIAPKKPKQETPADSTSPTDTSSEVTETPLKASDFHHLTLRANLLHWATLTPDLGFEWRMNRHFGLLLNGSWTTWSWDHKNRRYALWKVSPEVRYYLGKQGKGFLGVMYHTGEFHYKLGKTGKQGNYQGGGLTGGYIFNLNRSLSLDFHAGAGYTYADYDEYALINDVRVHKGSKTKNYWGINQLGITLIWKLIK